MDPNEKSTELGYPTLNTDDEDGVGLSKREFDNDQYDIDKNNEKYDKELVSDPKVKANKEKLKPHIFKRQKAYWISYRYVKTDPSNAQFGVKIIEHYSIRGDFTFVSFIHHLKNPMSHRGHLRPVVYLDGTMLEKVSDGEWKIKD